MNSASFKNLLSRLLPFFLYLALAVISYFPILESSGVISYRNDWEIPPLAQQFLTGLTTRIFAWNPQQVTGVIYSVGSDTYYWFVLYLIGQLGGEFTSKFMIMAVTVGCGCSTYYLVRTLGRDRASAWICGAFYTYTSYFFNQLNGGILNSLVSYALAPLFLLVLIRGFEKDRRPFAILVGGVLALAMTYIDYVVILPIIGIVLVLLWDSNSLLKRAEQFGIALVTAVVLHFYWILPLLHDLATGSVVLRRVGEVAYSVVRLYYIQGSTEPIYSSLELYSSFFSVSGYHNLAPFWYALNLAIPLFAFSAMFLYPRNKRVLSFTVIAILGVLFAAGTSVLGSLYANLLLAVPYLQIFTITIRWSPLEVLPFSVLTGFSISWVLKRAAGGGQVASVISGKPSSDLRKTNWKRPLFACLILVLLLSSRAPAFYAPPQYVDQTLQTYSFNNGEIPTYQYLSGLPGDFRIAYFPLIGYVQPSSLSLPGADPMAIYPPKPAVDFAGGPTDVTDSAALTRLISMGSYQQFSGNLACMMGMMNVGDIEYDNSTYDSTYQVLYRPQFGSQTAQQASLLSGFLNSQSGLQKVYENGSITVYSNPSYLPHLFATNDLSLISGSLTTIVPVCAMGNLLDPRYTSFVLSNQLSQSQLLTYGSMANRTIIYNNDILDTVISLLPTQYIIDPGKFATAAASTAANPYDQFGWVPTALEWWAEPLYPSSEGLGMITSTNDSIGIPFEVNDTGSYRIFADVYHDPRSGTITYSADGNLLNQSVAYSSFDVGYQWESVGNLTLQSGSHTLEIGNRNGTSSILELVIAPTAAFSQAEQEAETIFSSHSLMLINKPESLQATVFESNASSIYFVPSFDRVNVGSYSYRTTNSTFSLSVPLGGNSTTNEAVIAHLNFPQPIPVAYKDSSLSVSYELQNSSAQLFYPKLELDTTGSGKVDTILDYMAFNSYPEELSNVSQTIKINLNSVLDALHIPAANSSKVTIRGIDLIFQKQLKKGGGWVDLSQSSRTYNFKISDVRVVVPSLNLVTLSTFGYSSNGGTARVMVPTSGSYNIYVRLRATNTTTLSVDVDGMEADVQVNASSTYNWYSLAKLPLSAGYHNMIIKFNPNVMVDLFATRSTSDTAPSPLNQVGLSYRELNPTQYQIDTETNRSAYLVFLETFDNSWQLTGQAGSSSPVEGDFFGNLYRVGGNTDGTMQLSYAREAYFQAGFVVAGVAWVFVLGIAFVYLFPRSSRGLKRILGNLRPT